MNLNYTIRLQKSLLLTALYLLLAYTSHAQSTVWEYDCRADKFTKGPDLRVKEGNILYIKYTKVNPFAVNSNLVISGFTEDFATANALVANLLSNATAAASQSDKKASAAKDNQDAAGDTVKSLTKALTAKKRSAAPASIKKANADIAKAQAKFDSLTVLNGLHKQKKDQEDEISSKSLDIINEQTTINDAILLDTIVTDAMKDPNIYDANALNQRVSSASSLFNTANPRQTLEDVKSSLKNINSALADIKAAIIQLQQINVQVNAIDKSGKNDFSKELDSLTAITGKLTILYATDNALKLLKGVTGTILNYEKLATSTFELPVRKIGQVLEDVDTVTDNLKLSDNTIFKTIGPYKVFPYGGNRVNVSLGFAATFGNLNATSYSLVRDADSKVTAISSGRQNSIGNFSPILFVHYLFKIKSSISPAISVGLNPDFSGLSNSRLLVGGSLSLSESNSLLKRILITGGLGMGFTDCIKPKYLGITDYSTLNSLSDSDLTEKAFQFGGFFGVSFNLSK